MYLTATVRINVADYSTITQTACLDSTSGSFYGINDNCFELDFENSNDDSMDIYLMYYYTIINQLPGMLDFNYGLIHNLPFIFVMILLKFQALSRLVRMLVT